MVSLALFVLESRHSLHHVVKIDFIAVELRAVYAYELSLVADLDPAASAHACTINHYCVEGCGDRYVVGTCSSYAELHHDCRADRDYFADFLALANFLQRLSNHSFTAIRAVISYDDKLITGSTHLVLKEEQFFSSCADDGDNFVADFVVCLNDRMKRSDSDSSAYTEDCAVMFLDVSGFAQRPDQYRNIVALVEGS